MRIRDRMLLALARAPFADIYEIGAIFIRGGNRHVYQAENDLRRQRLTSSFRHSTITIPYTTRHYLTRAGIAEAARVSDESVADFMADKPLTPRLYTRTLNRLDTTAPIYRLAAATANVLNERVIPHICHVAKNEPEDGAIQTSTMLIPVIRQLPSTPMAAIGRRIYNLIQKYGSPPITLVICPTDGDRIELSHRLTAYPIETAVIAEPDLIQYRSTGANWETSYSQDYTDLSAIIAEAMRYPFNPPPPTPTVTARERRIPRREWSPDNPYILAPTAQKKLLNALECWPLSTTEQLSNLVGSDRSNTARAIKSCRDLDLITSLPSRKKEKSRHALSDAGLRAVSQLARQTVSGAIHRDSAETSPTGKLKGSRTRARATLQEHNDGALNFASALSNAAGQSLRTIHPPHRAIKSYTDSRGLQRSVYPDAVLWIELADDPEPTAIIIEWEIRARFVSSLKAKIRPYNDYWRAGAHLRDYPGSPLLCIIFELASAERNFHAALAEMQPNGGDIPTWLTTQNDLAMRLGPLQAVWRTPRLPDGTRISLPRARRLTDPAPPLA